MLFPDLVSLQTLSISPSIFTRGWWFLRWWELRQKRGSRHSLTHPPPSILSARLSSCLLNRAFLVAQMVKNLPAMQETLFQSLGWEDPLEKEMAWNLAGYSPWRYKDSDKTRTLLSFPGGLYGKEFSCTAGDLGLIPGLWKSPAGGHATHSSILALHGQTSLAGYL